MVVATEELVAVAGRVVVDECKWTGNSSIVMQVALLCEEEQMRLARTTVAAAAVVSAAKL